MSLYQLAMCANSPASTCVLQALVQEWLNDLFDYYTLPGVQKLEITHCDLGEGGLTINSIRSHEHQKDDERMLDVKLSFYEPASRLSLRVSLQSCDTKTDRADGLAALGCEQAKLPGFAATFTLRALEVVMDVRFYVKINEALDAPHIEMIYMSLLEYVCC